MNLYSKRKIIRKHNASFQVTEDILAVEKRLSIALSGEELYRNA